MENTDQGPKFQGVRDPDFYDRVDKILADPATADGQREDIDAILFGDGLNRLLAEEG
jgi:hypothetical protein